MTLFFNLIILGVSIVLLYYGARYLVRGSANLGRIMGIKPIIIGLTVVAFGTSMPEFLVSLFGVIQNASDISVGNVIGSNIANIGLILGTAGLIAPISLKYSNVRQQLIILLMGSLFFTLLAFNGISRLEGILFVLLLVVYIFFLSRNSKKEEELLKELPEEDLSVPRNVLFTLGGILGLVLASKGIIDSASYIAAYFGISQMVIGMTVVAIGTSLPELAASIMAQIRQESDISIGNVIGSNLFNMFFVAGGAATIKGLPIDTGIYRFEVPVMLLFTVLLFPVIFLSKGIRRPHAALLLLLYVLFIVISYLWR